jgi:hypothetical protein
MIATTSSLVLAAREARSMGRSFRLLEGLRERPLAERVTFAGMMLRGWSAVAERYLGQAKGWQALGNVAQAKRAARAYGAAQRRAARYERLLERLSIGR